MDDLVKRLRKFATENAEMKRLVDDLRDDQEQAKKQGACIFTEAADALESARRDAEHLRNLLGQCRGYLLDIVMDEEGELTALVDAALKGGSK